MTDSTPHSLDNDGITQMRELMRYLNTERFVALPREDEIIGLTESGVEIIDNSSWGAITKITDSGLLCACWNLPEETPLSDITYRMQNIAKSETLGDDTRWDYGSVLIVLWGSSRLLQFAHFPREKSEAVVVSGL